MAEEITGPDRERRATASRRTRFRLDLREVSTVGLDDARKLLVIDVWTPEQGVRTIKRA